MAFKVLVHGFNANDCQQIYNITDYSFAHATGILTMTQNNLPPATGTSAVTVNTLTGFVTRIEIFPQADNFPGNTIGTPSG